METKTIQTFWIRAAALMARLLIGLSCFGIGAAQAVTIEVTGPRGATLGNDFTGYRYTIEEDGTYPVVPGVTGLSGNLDTDPTLSLKFHRSHMPVVKVGHVAGKGPINWTPPDPAKRYFVSVMPDNQSFGTAGTGYTMSGTDIPVGAGTVKVQVNPLPFKTSQVSVFVFEDNGPINGTADAPGVQEKALCGFEVQLFEAGGTYGASGGRVATDTFGNLLGTEYGATADDIVKPGSNQLWSDRNGVVRIKNLAPAKYTIYSIAPPVAPSIQRCRAVNANGSPSNFPIWTTKPADIPGGNGADAQFIRGQQIAWDNGFELAPDAGDGDKTKWHQTTTIEGTWGVDAWVKAGEPTFFKEFGPPGHHVWHGWVRRFKDTTALNGPGIVTGTVVNTHMSRPPGITFHSGAPITNCWVGINSVTAGVGLGQALYANACKDDGTFNISGLRAGQRYQLAVWDEALDNVIANYEFVATTGTVPLGNVPVFSWFSNLQGKVFYDTNGNAFPFDAQGTAKPGIPNTALNIRFRDGSIYNSTVTDNEGNYEFAEVFPFFNWMVAELDFTRFKARGATIVPDNGGVVVNPGGSQGGESFPAPAGLWPNGTMRPQLQPDNNNLPYRIFGYVDSAGNPVPAGATNGATLQPSSANLLQSFQGFLGQTNVIHWAMGQYNPNVPTDHGGITGIVHYASTRAENDPMFAAAENNEPGIPGVEIRLYKLNQFNRVVRPNGTTTTPEQAVAADAIRIVYTDSWNNSEPESCVDKKPYGSIGGEDGTNVNMQTGTDKSKCYDGMRIWNQVRDGVFDGGFGITDYCPTGVSPTDPEACVSGDPVPLPPGRYMTEAVAPYGYEHQKEEDKNVDFGDLLVPGTLSNPASCLGSRREGFTYDDNGQPTPIPFAVPRFLELFPDVEIPARFRDTRDGSGAIVARKPYCNKKLVVLAPGMNPFSDFNMFTKVPVAGHIVGMILDDLANEFDPYAPSFGEKYAPPFMPISIRDYAGNEISRVYSDRYGTYNAMVPSTFAFNVPLPSGVAPNMVNVCLNSPTMKDGTLDPHYNSQYTQYCYTFQYLPGKTTYLDTPVLPIAAFAGPSQYALDTEQPDGTPGIKQVVRTDGGSDAGPWVPSGAGSQRIRIDSMGTAVAVNNPAFDQNNLKTPGAGVPPKTVTRDFSFGTTAGQVFIGGVLVPSGNVTWGPTSIAVNPRSSTGTAAGTLLSGTVEVVRSNGRKSPRGVTLHTGTTNMTATAPITVSAGGSIQAAIDSASDGDLILVGPGVYEEAPIVWKRVRVQGWGAPVSIVNASMGADYLRQQHWREKACDLVLNQGMSAALLPGQAVPADMNACLTGDTVDNAPLLFASEEASGFFVLGRPLSGAPARMANDPYTTPSLGATLTICRNNMYATGEPLADIARALLTVTCPVPALQIDGFTVTGADTGGGIVANGNATQLQLSNNRITGNQGLYNGGIRIGHAGLNQADLPVSGNNLLVNIHHNEILKNGNLSGEVTGGGGGVSIYTGSSGYRVADNYIAGNFSTGDGGGMAHFGMSSSHDFDVLLTGVARLVNTDNRIVVNTNLLARSVKYASTVSNNQFRFNQSFSQAKSVQGGGLAVVGVQDPVGTGITLGTGSMVIANNTFQGNLAGAGDGGGIALVGVNGTEISANFANWNQVDILNNVIVNNGSGVAGAGISMQDAAKVNIVNNTVATNDSYATAARAFQRALNANDPNNLNLDQLSLSLAQGGAGIAAYGHSPALLAQAAALGAAGNNQTPVPATKKQFADATITNTVVTGNRRYNWALTNAPTPNAPCAYTNTGASTAGGTSCFGLTLAAVGAAGNDIAVRFGPANATLSPTYSVFTAVQVGDGTNSSATNKVGAVGGVFSSAYYNGSNGALKQLLYSLEQTVVIGSPVLEVQEPTVATTAAAFDEGGNFIDVRFGPLTRGACNPLANWDSTACTTAWNDFGTYTPAPAAIATNGAFTGGLNSVTGTWPALLTDRNGLCRGTVNILGQCVVTQNATTLVRGAFKQ